MHVQKTGTASRRDKSDTEEERSIQGFIYWRGQETTGEGERGSDKRGGQLSSEHGYILLFIKLKLCDQQRAQTKQSVIANATLQHVQEMVGSIYQVSSTDIQPEHVFLIIFASQAIATKQCDDGEAHLPFIMDEDD